MLTELSIRNFAIIDDLSIAFHDGLTVLTGETGAGKSIIIDAVQLLTGSRASVEYVRYGAKKAEINGLFAVDENFSFIEAKCEKYGIEMEDGTLILDRTITNKGKSVCRINGKMVTLGILREIGQSLINVHSQHDTMHLMDKAVHLKLLDKYNEKEIFPVKTRYMEKYHKYRLLKMRHDELNANEQQLAQRLDMLQFQLNELTEAQLEAGEDIRLDEERIQLQNYEKIYHSVQEAYHSLAGENKGLEWIDIAQSSLKEAMDYDASIKKRADDLTSIFFNLEEIGFYLRDFIEELHFDEGRLNEIEARLDEINRLKKKYGSTVEEMLDYLNKVEVELEELQHKETHLEKLESEMADVKNAALKEAKNLHSIRKKTAVALESDMKGELKDLYLENAAFSVAFDVGDEQLTEDGIDRISFMLSANLGEPLKELAKIASGGELSRIMLALNKIFARHDNFQTVIFDEIDTGVSGRVAQAIAEKMYQISTTTQVLCITHLPQVAAMSDHHILIQKEEKQSRTSTSLKELGKKEKVQELGRMMTGAKLTETAIEHSEELLELTNSFKRSIKS